MPSLLSIRNLNVAFSLLLLAGCAQYNSGLYGYSNPYNDPYLQSDFDELLGFGANMAQIPPSSRAEVCGILMKRQKKSSAPEAGIQLHLLVGRLFSDACGDIPGILNGVGSIPASRLSDERMRRLVAIHTEALKRLNSQSRKLGYLERKHKTVQNVLESKDASGSKKDETRFLREKLEAIRSMEKHLDETGDVN